MARSRRTMKYLGAVSVFLVLALLLMGVRVGLPLVQASGDPTWNQTTFADFFNNSEKSDVLVIDIGEGDGDVQLAYNLSSGLANWPSPTETPTRGSQAPIWDKKWDAHTFTADADGNVSSILPYVGKDGSPGNLTVELRDTVSSKPGNTTLASATIPSSDITTAGGIYEVIFSTPQPIINGTEYAIVLHQQNDEGSAQNSYHWYYDDTPGYAAGRAWKSEKSGDAGSWTNFGSHDFCFMINPQAQYYSSGYLISSPHDATYSANFGTISWNATVPIGTSLKFQIATNSDGSTWNFLGPDGNSSMFYEISGSEIWSGHDGDLYIKYKVYFATTNTTLTPVLHDVSITYTELTYTLTTNASPPEGGTVTGGGTYPYGTDVEVEAIPADECWYFTGWSGDLSGTENPTTIHIDGDKAVTANFAKYTYTLTANASPAEGGSVTGGGSYNCSTNVDVEAIPADDCWYFTGWSGDLSGTENSTTIHIDGDKAVTANFAKYTYTLTANASPAEGGSVSGSGSYDCGTYAAINATANESYQFVNWSGDDITNASEASTTVLINEDKTVTANFAKIQYTLTMQVSGSGTTTPSVGSHEYAQGTVVNINATPASGWRFDGWTGDVADPNSATTTVTMDANKTVTANFSQISPGGGGGGGGGWVGPVCSETLTVDFLGEITETRMTRSGVLCDDCVALSPDEMHWLEIEEDTKVLDSEGDVVKLIEITEATPPSLPASTVIVGSAYNFSPSGITFSQPVNLTLGYNVGDLPEDTLALSMEYYSSEEGWVELESESSQVAEIGSLTGTTEHFTVFAILADLPSFEVSNLSITPSETDIWGFLAFAVRTGAEAVITIDVANNANHEASYTVSLQVNGEIRATQEITLVPGQSEQVVFTITGNEPGQYVIVVDDLSEEFTSSLRINWLLIIDIFLILALIGLLAWWYRRRGKPVETAE